MQGGQVVNLHTVAAIVAVTSYIVLWAWTVWMEIP
jgi:hypothetical protein